MVRGFVTAGEAWVDRGLQKRLNQHITPAEFKKRLDAGETLRFCAMYVFLKGTPAEEDIDEYVKAYKEKEYRYIQKFGPLPVIYPEAELEDCFDIAQICSALDKIGIPSNDEDRLEYLLLYLEIHSSHRFPEEYADKPGFEEIAEKLIRINMRRMSVDEGDVEGMELWKLVKITNLENKPATDWLHQHMLDKEYYIVASYRGIEGKLGLADEKCLFINTSTVIYTERDNDAFKMTTRDNVYYFERAEHIPSAS
jgi:hypothetical protein